MLTTSARASFPAQYLTILNESIQSYAIRLAKVCPTPRLNPSARESDARQEEFAKVTIRTFPGTKA